jgi:PKD repeat protein
MNKSTWPYTKSAWLSPHFFSIHAFCQQTDDCYLPATYLRQGKEKYLSNFNHLKKSAMQLMNKKYHLLFPASLLAFLFVVSGCSPDKPGPLGTRATASFTITPVPNRVNTYVLQSTSQNAFGFQWDKGNGQFVKGKEIDTAYFPLKGTYTVKLRAFGRGGYDSTAQAVTVTVDDILNNPTFKLLTAKSWKLDPAAGANAIVVGTEANPSQYFGGGALADCQKDDVYTFTTDMKLTYSANGSTFNAGNLVPNFTCSTDRSYTSVDFTFLPTVSAGAGIAGIQLTGTPPARFIGVTDVSSNNYRIISITPTTMVLRSGTPSETVHQFKFIAQ